MYIYRPINISDCERKTLVSLLSILHLWSPNVWGFSHTNQFSSCPDTTGCPMIKSDSDTNCLGLASDPTG